MNARQGWNDRQFFKAEAHRQSDNDEMQLGGSNGGMLLGRRVFGDVNSRNVLGEVNGKAPMSAVRPGQVRRLVPHGQPYHFSEDTFTTPRPSRIPTSPRTPKNCLQPFIGKTLESDGAFKDLDDDEPMYGSPGSRLSTPSIGTPTTDEHCSPTAYSYSKFMIDDDILLKPHVPDKQPARPTRDMNWYRESFQDSRCVTLAPQPSVQHVDRPRALSVTSDECDKDFLQVDSPVLAPTKDAIFEGGPQNVDLVARPRNFAVFAPTPISNVLESWVRNVREGRFEGEPGNDGVSLRHLADGGRKRGGLR
ncbi:hypothetical protein BSKO_09317 [Bryopsis sp. KO-2023]|nr:hypothetical protein BSKO_09317 [Bryopsis sp. KO-2023]